MPVRIKNVDGTRDESSCGGRRAGRSVEVIATCSAAALNIIAYMYLANQEFVRDDVH